MPEFSCPMCGASRPSFDSDCEASGWKRQAAESAASSLSRCPLCASPSFSWGRLETQWGIKFKSEDSGLLEQLGRVGGEKILARKCDGCGNVQLFIE